MKVKTVKNILDASERIALENKKLFEEKKVFVINLMGSPGCGKTSLVEHTIESLKKDLKISVIEGDVQSSIDAERVGKHGVTTVQINTGGACHLDGNMIREALPEIDLAKTDLLIVENVGNLVCPAEFKVGENFKIMILSVAEGDDKPKKYPLMFRESKVVLINKTDLLPYTDFDIKKAKAAILEINPEALIFDISCKTLEGINGWTDWLGDQIKRT